MQKYTGVVIDAKGSPMTGVTVTVNVAGGSAATIYSDNGVTTKANPFSNDANGSFEFYAANGRYDIVLAKTGVTFVAPDTTDIALFDSAGTALGSYLARGCDCKNNTTTPNTQYDLDADQVQLFRPSDGSIVVRQNPGVLTNNVSTAGPAAGGRDQAGAFSASSWIHFYWIWNGTTLSTVSSASAPTGAAGPTMPTGYTHWAYAGAVRFNGSSQLIPTRIKGSWAYYDAEQNLLSAGTATTETSITTSALYPPNALAAQGRIFQQATSSGGGGVEHEVYLRVVSGSTFHLQRLRLVGAATNDFENTSTVIWPVTGSLFYHNVITVGSAPRATIDVHGYKLPNGGE